MSPLARSCLALVVTSLGIVACSGAASPSIPDVDGGSGGGGTGTGTPPPSADGGSCEPCPPAPPGCTGTGPCGCPPFVCPDAGGEPSPCTWGEDTCPSGTYCNAPGCRVGVCSPIGRATPDVRAPVCGCDGITFWNRPLAESRGVSVRAEGECPPGNAARCFDNGSPCPSGALCSRRVPGPASCAGADVGGSCWALPPICPLTVGDRVRPCGAPVCTSQCQAIRDGQRYDTTSYCP